MPKLATLAADRRTQRPLARWSARRARAVAISLHVVRRERHPGIRPRRLPQRRVLARVRTHRIPKTTPPPTPPTTPPPPKPPTTPQPKRPHRRRNLRPHRRRNVRPHTSDNTTADTSDNTDNTDTRHNRHFDTPHASRLSIRPLTRVQPHRATGTGAAALGHNGQSKGCPCWCASHAAWGAAIDATLVPFEAAPAEWA